MNRPGRVLMYAGITVMIGAGMSGCFTTDDERQDVSYGIDQPVRTLVIEGGAGDVRVTGGGSLVSVTEHQTYHDEAPVAAHAVSDGTLTLTYHCPADDCGVGYDVHVPADTVVRVHGTNGGVTLTGLRAEVEARTSNGSIRASGLSSAVVRLASRRGDVSADFAADPTEVRVTTEHGDLRVTVPKGRPYAVAASAAIGGVKVDVAQQADAPRGIAARTETGDVTVTGA